MRTRIALFLAFLLVPVWAQEEAKKEEPKKEEVKAEEAKPAAAAPAEEEEGPLPEGPVSGTIDVGWRWIGTVYGNPNTYRSVVNLGEGVRLMGLDLSFKPTKLYDTFHLIGSNWGGDPYNTMRADLKKSGAYRALIDYRNIAYFNALPSFASALLNERGPSYWGVNSRSYDASRRLFNADIDFLPGKRIIPFFGWQYQQGKGSGLTPLVLDGNEYPFSNRIGDRYNLFRGGVRFEYDRWHVTLEQGGGMFKDENSTFNSSGVNFGERFTPINGQKLFIEQGTQVYRTTGDNLYSSVSAGASPFSWMNLAGQFLYSRPRTYQNFSENAIGNIWVQNLFRFFNRTQSLATGYTIMPHTSGLGSVELRPFKRFRVLESFWTDRFHNAANPAITQQFFATQGSPEVFAYFTPDRLVLNYNRQQLEGLYDFNKWITFRGGHRYTWGDAGVRRSSLDQASGLEPGALKMHAGLFGVSVRVGSKLVGNIDGEFGRSQSAYFRTSLYNYTKGTGRLRWNVRDDLSVNMVVGIFDNLNPNQGQTYRFRSDNFGAGFYYTPKSAKRFSVLGEYSRTTFKSNASYFNPFPGGTLLSQYRDFSHLATLASDVKLFKGTTLTMGGTLFVSSGTRPTEYYQPLVRFIAPMSRRAQVYAEYRNYSMGQTFYSYESFRTNQFVTGIRIFQ